VGRISAQPGRVRNPPSRGAAEWVPARRAHFHPGN